MDPDAALVALLVTFADAPASCGHVVVITDEDCAGCEARLHALELMGDLNHWLRNGGFMPHVSREQLNFQIGSAA